MITEIVGNMHLHTTASDGAGTADEVAAAAAEAGLDFILYTDHNVWTADVEGWYHDPASGREILRLMGQEVNDRNLDPEYNHLLCYFTSQNLQPAAAKPQALIDTALTAGGLCFIAHPLERPGMAGHEDIYPWVDWPLSGFTGIELWNTMSEVKWQLRSLGRALLGIVFPRSVLSGPFPETLAKWDELLAGGQNVVAIGNADAHALVYTKGPLRYQIYAYQFLFRAVNTHLLLDQPLSRDIDQARRQVYHALKQGHCFVGYDLPASPRGFSFTATSGGQQASMGDTLSLQGAVTLTVSSPRRAWLRLLKDGQVITEVKGQQLTWEVNAPGVYRVEAYRWFWGRRRGWVFTNPIYVV